MSHFRRNWLVPLLLLLLGSLNILFGALRLDALIQGRPDIPNDTMHYFDAPIPITSHIVFGILLNLLGPLQFAPILRKRYLGFHRWSGRLLLLSGLVVAISGLWMNHYFPPYGGVLKYSGIATYSLAMMLAFVLAILAVRKGNITAHRAWMMRAIAIGLAPATQRVFIIPIFIATGIPNDLTIGLVIWWGLLLNLGVVEWNLWQKRGRPSLQKATYAIAE